MAVLLRENISPLTTMLTYILAIFFMFIPVQTAMAQGRVFPTRFPMKTPPGSQRLVVKNVSETLEFADLVSDVDNTRRFLELREGINEAKEKYNPRFTFKCMCGTPYSSVFRIK